MITRMHVGAHSERRASRLGFAVDALAGVLAITVLLGHGVAHGYLDEEMDHDEIVERLDEQEARNDELEGDLGRLEHRMNMRDPVWRAKTLKRCHEHGRMESSRLCSKLHREQTWWEWLTASVDSSGSKAVTAKRLAPGSPAKAAASSAPLTARDPALRGLVRADPSPLPTRSRRSEAIVMKVRTDGSMVRLIYDIDSGALVRSEELGQQSAGRP